MSTAETLVLNGVAYKIEAILARDFYIMFLNCMGCGWSGAGLGRSSSQEAIDAGFVEARRHHAKRHTEVAPA